VAAADQLAPFQWTAPVSLVCPWTAQQLAAAMQATPLSAPMLWVATCRHPVPFQRTTSFRPVPALLT